MFASDTFWPLLAESLTLLAQHQPGIYRMLAETLQDTELQLEVDGETASLRWLDGQHSIGPPLLPALLLRTDRAVILALVDGRADLPTVLHSDDLQVVAPLPHLVVAFDALVLYLNGVARLIEASQLLIRYRAAQKPLPQG